MDVRFSGSYYVSGMYDHNSNLAQDGTIARDAFYQQMRVQTDFMIAEGLKVTTRFDALERVWGQTNWRSMTAPNEDKTNSRPIGAVGTQQNLQENFEFEQAYLTFMTRIGQFAVGYQAADAWGTAFANSTCSRPRIVYSTKLGPMTLLGVYEKISESDTLAYLGGAAAAPSGKQEDADSYAVGAIYNAKGIEAGMLLKYYDDNRFKQIASNYASKLYLISPYAKATFGPVYLEGEINYFFGKIKEFDNVAGASDVDMAAWSAYGMAKVNFGPAYVGGLVGWVQGDGSDATKVTNNYIQGGGYDWKPMLSLNNVDSNSYLPGANSHRDVTRTDPKGYIVYSLIGGFTATPKLLFEGALSWTAYDKDTSYATQGPRVAPQPAA
jgi:hypothetical protein